MNKIINLELADPNSYKQPFKESYKNLDFINIIFEILGSVQKLDDIKLKINIYITNNNIFIYHNGIPLDQEDVQRLLKIATHKLKKNKKGVSKQGIGWRAVATVSSNKNFEKDGYDEESFYEYSSMISKIKSDITIEEDNLKSHEIISLVHDDNFQITIKKGQFYQDIYKQYLKKDFGVLFLIPNKVSFHYNLDRDVIHKLKILFNRLDCDIYYNNEITDFHKDIFKIKPFYYIDRQITNNKYMEINCEMFTYKSKNILKMEFIHTNNIKNIDVNDSHYFWMEGSSKMKHDDLIKKYDYYDWAIDIEDYSKLEPHNYSFKVRMMGFDPDTHQSNEDFKKWFNFYSPVHENITHGVKLEGYGDGIIPYIDDHCLKFATNETQKGYLKQKDFNPSKNLGRSGTGRQGTNIPWKRTIGNQVITYKPKQNFLCELIESRENINNEKTILTLPPIKSQTLVCNNKGYQKTIPFFLLWLSHKYIWTTSDVEINELTTEEQLEKSKEETKKEKE